MEALIILSADKPIPDILLFEDSNDALAHYCLEAEKLGVEYDFDEVANTDNQVGDLIHEVNRQLTGTGHAIHWFDTTPLPSSEPNDW